MPKIIGFIFSATMASALFIPTAVSARAEGQDNAVCLATAQGDTSRRSVTAEKAPALVAKGFVVVPCNGEQDQRAALHDDACRLAQHAPPKVQAHFEAAYGMSPDELCAATSAGTQE